MTIPKHAGLSRLAEAASPIEYYPVKRRGQRRRLTPNWDAINWLENETRSATEIFYTEPLGDTGMNQVVASGWYEAKRSGHYPRRMFDVFELEASSTMMIEYTDPCPDCYDFSRTWDCTEHPEVTWDTKRRVWERHIEDRTRCSCTPCTERRERAAEASSGYTDMGTDGLRPPQGLYDRLMDVFSGPLPQPGEDPFRRIVDAGRCTCPFCTPQAASYEESVLQENPELRQAVLDEARLAASRSGAWPVACIVLGRRATVHQDGTIRFHPTLRFDRVPDALMPSGRIDRPLADLPRGSITVNLDNTPATYTLRVTGETDQGTADFSVEVERDPRCR